MASECTLYLPIQIGNFALKLELQFKAEKLFSLCISEKSLKKEPVIAIDIASNS